MKKQLLTAVLAAGTLFTAQAQTPALENSGFETWEDYSVGFPPMSLERPVDWYGSDEVTGGFNVILATMGITVEQQLFESSDVHAGAKAARLVSVKLNDSLGSIPGVLTNAQASLNIADLGDEIDGASILSALSYTGGTAMHGNKVDTVSAWVKTPAGNTDASAIIITAMKKSTTSGGADTLIAIGNGTAVIVPDAGTAYRVVSVGMTYESATNTATDTLIVAFLSSAFSSETTVTPGNTLLIDDVSFVYTDGATSTRQPLMSENNVSVYPNPAKTNIWVNLDVKANATNYTLAIFDASGRNVYQKQLTQQINNIDVANWAAGTYFYQLTNKNTATKTGGSFIK